MGEPWLLVRTHKVEVRMTTKHWWFEIRKKCGVHQDTQEPTAVLLFKFHIWTHCGGTFTGPSFVLPQRNHPYPHLKRTFPPPLKRVPQRDHPLSVHQWLCPLLGSSHKYTDTRHTGLSPLRKLTNKTTQRTRKPFPFLAPSDPFLGL